MTMDPSIKLTRTDDGCLIASKPRTDGPTTAEYELPGEYGRVLRDNGYRARVVIERVDGGAIQPCDRAVLDDAAVAAQEHGADSPRIQEQVATGHLKRTQERMAAKRANGLKKTG